MTAELYDVVVVTPDDVCRFPCAGDLKSCDLRNFFWKKPPLNFQRSLKFFCPDFPLGIFILDGLQQLHVVAAQPARGHFVSFISECKHQICDKRKLPTMTQKNEEITIEKINAINHIC